MIYFILCRYIYIYISDRCISICMSIYIYRNTFVAICLHTYIYIYICL